MPMKIPVATRRYSDYIQYPDRAETAAQDATPTESYGNFGLVMSGLARTYRAATVVAMASISVRPGPARPVNGSERFGISCVRTCRFLWREMASRHARCTRCRREGAVS